MRRALTAATVIAGLLLTAGPASAQNPPPRIRASLANLDDAARKATIVKAPARVQKAASAKPRSTARTAAGGVLGAAVGFFAGGFTGSMLEGNCRCDDPGLQGFVIGAPIGALLGAAVGAKYF